MRKTTAIALLYVIVGMVLFVATIATATYMWCTTNILPVYIAGNYVVGNQILRYEIYLVCAIVFFISICFIEAGARYIKYKIRRWWRRRRRRRERNNQ